MKNLLKERFQQLAGIKPLYEVGQEEKSADIKAAAFPSHEDYKTIYFGDDQEFRDEGFEYIEAFTITPYTFILWNDEEISSLLFNDKQELLNAFNEMGFGMCGEDFDKECNMEELLKVVSDSQPDKDSGHGLALLKNGEVVAQGGDGGRETHHVTGMEDEIDEITGMECEECGEVHEGTCGYTTDDEGNKLNSPGGTNKRKYSATTQTNYMSDSRRNPLV
tara:strand:+ start:1046 stop:1705 length:660 start_codon:yes stop_codon:yes gene_type:complete